MAEQLAPTGEIEQVDPYSVDLSKTSPTESVSRESLIAFEQQQEKERPTLTEGLGAAYALESVWGTTQNNMQTANQPYDPNFRTTPEMMEKWTKDLDPELHEAFLDATSEEHGDAIRRAIDAAVSDEELLGKLGYTGVGLRMFAAMTDPIAWSTMIASEGAAAPWIFASKASRLSKAVKGAIVAGGSNAALETYLYSQSYTKSPTDILWAGLLGATLGGATAPFINNVHGVEVDTGLAHAIDEVGHAVQVEETRGLSQRLAEAAEEEPAPRVHEDNQESVEVDPAKILLDEHVKVTKDLKDFSRAYETSKESITTHRQTLIEASVERDRLEGMIEWTKKLGTKIDEDGAPILAKIPKNPEDFPADLRADFDDEELLEMAQTLQSRMEEATPEEIRKTLRTEMKNLDKQITSMDAQVKKAVADMDHWERTIKDTRVREKELVEQLTDARRNDSVGAARADWDDGDVESMSTDDIHTYLDEHGAPMMERGGKSRVRLDMVGRLLRSGSAAYRSMAARLGENAVGFADHAVAGKTASEIATFVRTQGEYRVMKVMDPAFKRWVHDSGGNFWSYAFSPSKRREFMIEVKRFIENTDSEATFHEAIEASGKAMRKEMANYLKLLKKAKVKGFEKIPEDPNYMPRLADRAAIRALGAEVKHSEIVRLIEGAIKKAMPDLDEVRAPVGKVPYSKRLATAYWKKIHNISRGMEADIHIPTSTGDLSSLREILKEADIPEDVIQGIEYTIKKSGEKKDAGKHSRAKSRLDLDHEFKLDLETQEGGIKQVSIRDLFEQDAERLFNIYGRQVSGQIGLAEVGFKSKAEFNHWVRAGLTEGGTQREADLLDFMYRGITGSPLENDPAHWLAATGRFVRDWNFLRVMGQVGWAQMAEFGNMGGTVGWAAVLTHMPEVRATMKRMKSGELEDDFANQLEAIWAIGTERLRNQVSTRYDEAGYGTGAAGSLVNKVDTASQYAKRVLADISLMAPVNMMLHRTAVKAVLQKLTDVAEGYSKQISPQRLASLGISEEMAPRILSLMKKHTSRKDSMFGKGRKINGLDHKAMEAEDPEAYDVLVHSVNRWVKKIIQENDLGTTHEWMHHSLGKILLQFRSFMLTAWGKQTLYNVHMNDRQSYASFMFSMMFGGLAYAAQTTINSVGREDQKEYLKERLSLEELGTAAFMRSGHASLIPATADTFLTTFLTDRPVFAHGRSTGLASNWLMGIPTVDLAQKVGGTLGIGKNIYDDHEFSQKNVRDSWGLLWGSNAMIMRNINNYMLQGLPVQSSKVYE